MTADPTRMFRKLAYNNRLANLRLHHTVANLLPGEWDARRINFFPTIKATLNHILIVDWFYVDALEGGTLGPKAFEKAEPFDTVEQLTEAQKMVDERLIAFCEALSADRLAAPISVHRGDRVQVDRCDDILSHVFQHQTHHRGQVHSMLAGTTLKPPQLDEFIVGDDAGARRDEMSILGWSEERLMR